ncbi:MAG: glycosyltransferase family 39 protein [Myxococcota bacterium]
MSESVSTPRPKRGASLPPGEQVLAVLAIVGLAWFSIPGTEQDIDGQRFSRGVLEFDIGSYAPHPPGYPVLMGLAKGYHALFGGAPHRAVAMGSVVGIAIATASLYAIARRLFDERVARLSLLLSLASPLIAIFSSRPLSDMLGTGLGLGAVACALEAHRQLDQAPAESTSRARAFAVATGALIALTLGTRLSAVPVTAAAGLSLLLRAPTRWAALAGGVGGLLLWAVPFFAAVPFETVARSMGRHAGGHFNHHGGSVLTVSDPMLRTVSFVRAMWAHGAGGPWSGRPPSTLFVGFALGLLAFAAPSKSRRAALGPSKLIGACWLVHFAWVMLAQNIQWQPRHVLPLVWLGLPWLASRALEVWGSSQNDGSVSREEAAPAEGGGAAAATQRWWPGVRRGILVAGLVAGIAESRRLVDIQEHVRPAPVRIAEYAATRAQTEPLIVATTQLRGWIQYRAPGVDVRRVRSWKEVGDLPTDKIVLVTSEVPGARRFGSPVAKADAEPFVSYVLYRMRVHERRPTPSSADTR